MIIYKQARTSIEKHRCLRETEGQFKTSIGGILLKYRAQWQSDTTSTIPQTSRAIY